MGGDDRCHRGAALKLSAHISQAFPTRDRQHHIKQ
jgi:hypothetical protein